MKLIIAGGGTGGHVFPAIAIAEALQDIDPSSQVFFIGTELGLEKTAVPKAGYPIEFVHVTGIKGRSYLKKMRALLEIPFAILASIRILRKIKPDALIGVGGYASGPSLLAAWLLRIPIAILEPNSIPGFTNRILGFFSKKIFGAFHKTGHYFSQKRFVVVGGPLRKEFRAALSIQQQPENRDLRLLFLGGSLGAKALNDVAPKTLALLLARHFPVQVIHQTGKNDFDRVQKTYQELHISADVRPFIDDMAATFSQMDLIICRSGASTCAEITAMGLPSILVPFPFAIYDHQTENAYELVEAGAAILLPQSEMTPEYLSETIASLIQKPGNLQSMRQAAISIRHTDAAQKIARAALQKFGR